MLTVNKGQLSALELMMHETFINQLTDEVQEIYSDQFKDIPHEAIRLLVESAIVRAMSYGFEFKSSLASFVHLMFAVAPNFYLHPAVSDVLTDSAIPIELRMSMLPECVPPNVWDEIAQLYDSSAW